MDSENQTTSQSTPETDPDDLLMTTSDLDEIRERKRKALDRLRKIEIEERQAFRRADSRRKILWGIIAQAAVKNGDIPKGQWKALMNKYIEADHDRAFLGLQVLTPPATEGAPQGQANPAAEQTAQTSAPAPSKRGRRSSSSEGGDGHAGS